MPRWNTTFEPNIDMRDMQLLQYIVEIEAFKRSILKIPLLPHAQQEINRMNIVRQVKGTTGIEGNTMSEQRIQAIIDIPEKEQVARVYTLEEQEVINAEKIFRFIRVFVKDIPDEPITESLIRRIHEMTCADCHYEETIAGQYRHHKVQAATYMTPDEQDVPVLMQQFITFINSGAISQGLHPLIRAILAHFYLISIHPFGDGNGRTSRALEAYILYQSGYNIRGFYSLSNYFYRHRQKYIQQLDDARFRFDGNMTEFVKFALQGFIEELERIQDDILQKVRIALFHQMVHNDYREGGMSTRSLGLLDYLLLDAQEGIAEESFKNRTHHVARSLYGNVGIRTLYRDFKYLEDHKFITIQDGLIRANLSILSD